jgi:hypothetical protein
MLRAPRVRVLLLDTNPGFQELRSVRISFLHYRSHRLAHFGNKKKWFHFGNFVLQNSDPFTTFPLPLVLPER